MTDKSSKRPTVWGVHSTPAEAVEAARHASAERIALLEAEVVRLTNERDQGREVAREMAERLDQWRHLGGGACPLCSDGRWFEGEHQRGCPVTKVRAWDAPKEAE